MSEDFYWKTVLQRDQRDNGRILANLLNYVLAQIAKMNPNI